MNDPAENLNEPDTSGGLKRKYEMLSHDIRSAIGGVTGNLSLVDLDKLDPKQREQILAAQSSANLLIHFLADMDVTLGTVKTKQSAPEFISIDTLGFVETIRSQWESLTRAKGLTLEISTAPSVPANLVIDTYRTHRIIGNIIQNSIKYAKSGTIEVTLSKPAQNELLIKISDEGPGFSQEALNVVFSYSGRPRGSSQLGSGLGLYIAKTLANELDGTVEAMNGEQGGACLSICLPLHPRTVRSGVTIMPGANLPDLSGLSILLVEDNVTNQIVVAQMLEAMGAQFELASDGLEGLAKIETEQYDIALVDIEMPRLSGLDLIRRIRARGDTRAHMPLVAFTAYAMREHRKRIYEAGADGLIAKPVTGIEDLGNAILRYIPHKSDSAQQASIDAPTTANSNESSSVVDQAAFDALHASIGDKTMSELLRRVDSDLSDVRSKIFEFLDKQDVKPVRDASHVLVSVAGAIGATDLQHKAQRLNTHCHGGNSDLIISAREECLDGIDALLDYVRNTKL